MDHLIKFFSLKLIIKLSNLNYQAEKDTDRANFLKENIDSGLIKR